MRNEELIDALQCTRHFALYQDCYEKNCYANSGKGLYCNIPKLMADAADALEAQQKALDECAKQLADMVAKLEEERNKTVTEIFLEEQLWWEDRCKELEAERMELIAKCRRLEAQLPKEGEWIDDNVANVPLDRDGYTTGMCRCSVCGDWLIASDEYEVRGRYCPNCGAKMKGEQE